ncbi:unnamed protein product, partial [marine sediment metagenome]
VIENIKDSTKFPEDQFYFGVNYIPFLNGYFSIKESKLCEYSENSNLLFFYAIPHEYKEDKIYNCLKFKEILKEWVVNQESKIIIDDMFEMIGYTMTTDTGYKSIVINCGPPNTAKTQLANIIEHTIGEENSMATSLKRLQDRFEARFLQWKILALASDMSDSIINDSSTIKNMTGGDKTNRAEIKGGDIYPFRPT